MLTNSRDQKGNSLCGTKLRILEHNLEVYQMSNTFSLDYNKFMHKTQGFPPEPMSPNP